jgi:hypothetical protein
MRKFKRHGTVVSSHLSTYEVGLLASLIHQLVDMVADGAPERFDGSEPEPTDPFEAWARDLSSDPDEPEAHDDPVLQRLFPNAYPHDPAAATDFRRFTEHDLKAKKIADAQVVLDALHRTEEGSQPVEIGPAETEAWLRTLTNVRLAVATRLGVTDAESAEELAELPEEDPRAFMASVYDWLGFAQETLVGSL